MRQAFPSLLYRSSPPHGIVPRLLVDSYKNQKITNDFISTCFGINRKQVIFALVLWKSLDMLSKKLQGEIDDVHIFFGKENVQWFL